MIKPRKNLREKTKIRLDKISELYTSGLTVAEISKQTGIPITTVWYTLEVGKIIKREAKIRDTIKLNEKSFDLINNELSAYWLGFLYADGSTSKYATIITLSTKDELHLVKFLDFIKSDVSIKRWNRTPLSPMSTVTISNVYMTNRLRDLGIIPRRPRLDLTLASLPQELIREFIRGYFDGDGWISKNPKNPFIGFTGREDIITWIENVLSGHLPINQKSPKNNKSSFEIAYYGKNVVNTISQWMYENASVSLDRKYNLSLQWKE